MAPLLSGFLCEVTTAATGPGQPGIISTEAGLPHRVPVGGEGQRYYQLLELFEQAGAQALASAKRGSRSNYRRTDEVVRQIIRYRFLDPDSSPEVIAQKLRQCGYPISASSVKRVIAQFGLQKKLHRCAPSSSPIEIETHRTKRLVQPHAIWTATKFSRTRTISAISALERTEFRRPEPAWTVKLQVRVARVSRHTARNERIPARTSPGSQTSAIVTSRQLLIAR